jgi:type I restriction enzyme S subunit
MEVRSGYKQTEVGVIPKDWEVSKLEKVISVLTDFTANGSFASLALNVKYLETPNYARLIRLTDIRVNFKNDGIFISKDSYNFLSKSKLFGGELLLANVGAYAGYSFSYPQGLNFRGSLGPNMFLIKFNESIYNAIYAYYSFCYSHIQQQLLSKSASSAQPKLNKQNVRECDICFPPSISEQTAIAAALSDADALIASLEKLIEKKRAIKQGAMQELLRPKEGWEAKKLGEIADILTGFPFPSSGYSKSGIRLLRCSNIKRGNTDWDEDISQYWPKVTAELLKYQLNCGDIVVAMDGSLVGKSFAQLSQLDLPAILLQRVARIRSKLIDINYLKEMVCSEMFTGYCDSVKTSSAIPHISPADIYNYYIYYPLEKSEQTLIATILSDMDAEITALEQKLGKYKLVKQGMMQELLTGRIRLI